LAARCWQGCAAAAVGIGKTGCKKGPKTGAFIADLSILSGSMASALSKNVNIGKHIARILFDVADLQQAGW
jgi:hypothetical protein